METAPACRCLSLKNSRNYPQKILVFFPVIDSLGLLEISSNDLAEGNPIMTTEYQATRREVAVDLNFNLSHIKRSLAHDIDRITALIESLEIWADKAPLDQYNGEAANRIYDVLSITNNSGWISSMLMCCQCSKQTAMS